MREPRFVIFGHDIIYSQAPVWALRMLAAGRCDPAEPDPGYETMDMEFHRSYAALLLRERGQ